MSSDASGEPLQAALGLALAQMDHAPAPPPSESEAERLLAYLGLMSRWGRTYNLTAVRDPGEALRLHLLDSLAVRAPLWRQLGGVPARLCDVGSGGGLPGVVLAATMPQVQVTCVDAVAKKTAFVRQVAAELQLPNLRAVHARVEALHEAKAQIVTSRAFASLRDFADLTRHLLTEDGVWVAMKGKVPQAEIAELPVDIEVFHVEPLQIPSLDAERCLVWMRPTERR